MDRRVLGGPSGRANSGNIQVESFKRITITHWISPKMLRFCDIFRHASFYIFS